MKTGFRAPALATLASTLLMSASGAFAVGPPRSGGDLIVLQSSYPPCLDVAQSARAQNATRQALDTLLEQDRKNGEVVPWLATGWAFESDGKRIVLTLREDVTFSNGEKLDAAAVKANFDNLSALGKAGQAGQAASYLGGYVGADVLGPYKVALNFEIPKAGFLQALTEKTLAPLAPATLARTPDERCAGAVIGAGPFVISEVVKNDRITLKRRADYAWPSPNANHKGPAYLDSVTFRTVSEGSVRVGALLSGQVHAIDEPPTDDLDRIKSAGAGIVGRTAGGVGLTLYPNLAQPVLADEAVRAALQKGINRKEIVESLFSEYDTPSTSILSSTVPGQVDLGARLAYDVAGASAILDKAGWVKGPDGIRTKGGIRLSLEVVWSFPGNTPMLELIREQLKPIGIELILKLRPDSEIGTLSREGKYQLRLSDLTRPDPDVLNSLYGTVNTTTFLPVPEVAELLTKQSRALDAKDRAALVRQIQEIIIDKGYGFPIKESVTIVATAPKVSGLWLSTPRWPVLYDTWIDAK